MKSICALFFLFSILSSSVVVAFNTPDVVHIRVSLDRRSMLAKELGRQYSVTGAGEDYLDLMVRRSDLVHLAARLPAYEIIYENQHAKIVSDFGADFEDYFHDFGETVQLLFQTAQDHPDIVKLDTLGYSVENRVIVAAKVTDNPGIEENEPEFRLLGLHHGNEMMSTELCLGMLEYLTDNYGSDPTVTSLVDNLEIWIIPMMNPDGRMATPDPIRWNANGADLNRDYGYMWNEVTPAVFSQPETRAIRDNGLENTFVLSLSYHTTGDIVNYVWNYSVERPPDIDLVEQLSLEYGSFNGYWVVQGYDWYKTNGDCNDWSYGSRSSIDWTIEMADYNIEEVWGKNRDAVITLLGHADEGVRGLVTDADSGDPIEALIDIEEIGYVSYNDPSLGDYHRALLPGTYTITFSSPGYLDKTVQGVVVNPSGPTVLDVALRGGGDNFASQVISCYFYDSFTWPNEYSRNPTNANYALGYPDGVSASLGEGGNIVLDMGASRPLWNMEGNDFTVYEEDPPDVYSVLLSNNFTGPWTYLGTGTGTSSFDIETAGFSLARYVKIVDSADGDPQEWYPGCDIDAVVAVPMPNAVVLVHDRHSIDDTAGGNGDGMIDPGEIVDVQVSLANLGVPQATGVTARLSISDPLITVTEDVADYPDIPGGETRDPTTPFTLSVSDGHPRGLVVTFDLSITADGGYQFEASFSTMIGSREILLVDDDDGDEFEEYFTLALDQAGYVYDSREVTSQGAPAAADLSGYQVVIWTTADDPEGTLTPADRAALSVFLDNGGMLFLSSQDYIYDIGIDSFATDYLHLEWGENDVTVTSVSGIGEDPISNDLDFTLSYPPNFNNWSDDILPDSTAAGIFLNTGYDGRTPEQYDYYGAIRYPASGTAGFKTVFFAVPFDAVPQDGSSSVLMNRILEWFGISPQVGIKGQYDGTGSPSLPKALTLFQNYPNPFNPATTITFDIPGTSGTREMVNLTIYDIRGRRVKCLVDSKLDPGRHSVTWNGRNGNGQRVSSGIYLYTIQSSGGTSTRKMLILK